MELIGWVWRGFGVALGESDHTDSKSLFGFGVGFGWVWAKSKSLILNHLLALALALGVIDSKGLLGFGNALLFCNRFFFSNMQNSVALGAPGLHFFALRAG